MNLKKLLLLDRCRRKGFLTIRDIDIVYNFPTPDNYNDYHKQNLHKYEILKGLELQGYLKKVGEMRWELTEKGFIELQRNSNEGEYESIEF